MMNCNNCGYCGQCQEKKKCANPCSCAEPVFSVEAMPDDPNTLRFNVNGKSVWYDFEPVTKAGETCTTIAADAIHRLLRYNGECGEQTITAKELGSILHLSDIGDVNITEIEDNGILTYQREANCGEGCEGVADGWVAYNPTNTLVSGEELTYILGTDADGKMASLRPPVDGNTFDFLVWAGADKAKWFIPPVVTTLPTKEESGHTYSFYLCIDPTDNSPVIYKKQES